MLEGQPDRNDHVTDYMIPVYDREQSMLVTMMLSLMLMVTVQQCTDTREEEEEEEEFYKLQPRCMMVNGAHL